MSNRCPLMSCRAEEGDHNIIWIDCLEGDCALWYEPGGSCAIRMLAGSIDRALEVFGPKVTL